MKAKASQTPSAHLFSGARRVRGHLDEPARPCEVLVAYGGDEQQCRSDGVLVPWSLLHRRSWT